VFEPALILEVGQVWEIPSCCINITSKRTQKDFVKNFI